MAKPNVLVAGFPKSGSTFLYHLFKQHPQIFVPKIKEINYFNKDNFFLSNPEILNPRYFKKFKWYLSFFNTSRECIVDFSILSCLDVSSARRVKKQLGDIKILFIIRNKEDYLKSLKNFITKEGGDPKEAIERYSDIDYYIDNYKREFSNVYIVSLESLNKNPQRELSKVLKFLELKPYKFNVALSKKARHETSVYKMDLLQYLKRKIYVFLTNSFYRLISFTVMASAKAQGEN